MIAFREYQPASELGKAALRLAALGYAVFPVRPGAVQALTRRGCFEATTNPVQIADWWRAHPTANVGLATGGPKGLIVLDLSGEEDEECYAAMRVSRAPEVRTRRGRQVYLSVPPKDAWEYERDYGYLFTVRGAGSYAIAPPSYVNGHTLVWTQGCSLEELSPAIL